MNQKLKELVAILLKENASLDDFKRLKSMRMPTTQISEEDRVFTGHTLKYLQREWLKKKACCN